MDVVERTPRQHLPLTFQMGTPVVFHQAGYIHDSSTSHPPAHHAEKGMRKRESRHFPQMTSHNRTTLAHPSLAPRSPGSSPPPWLTTNVPISRENYPTITLSTCRLTKVDATVLHGRSCRGGLQVATERRGARGRPWGRRGVVVRGEADDTEQHDHGQQRERVGGRPRRSARGSSRSRREGRAGSW